jgi:hypothetical protein
MRGKARGSWSADAKLRSDRRWRQTHNLEARCCVTIHEASLLGVIPATPSSSRVWFKVPIAELTVSTSGEKGSIRKRPAVISLKGEGFDLELTDVDEIFVNIQRYQAGRERSLLDALRSPS